MRDVDKFSITVYRKPTATGLYTRCDSYSDTSKKFALIRTLALPAKRICSPEHLAAELVKVRAILQRNGYPRPIVDQVVDSVVNKLPVETVKRKPIYLRLPWIGAASVAFKKRIQCLTRKAVPFCDAITSFTSRSRALIHPCRKDVLPTEDLSNVIYLFTRGCGHRYVGRTSRRLGDRVKQRLPRKLINSEQKGAEPDKEQQPVSARTRSHVTPEEVLDGPISSRISSLLLFLTKLNWHFSFSFITRTVWVRYNGVQNATRGRLSPSIFFKMKYRNSYFPRNYEFCTTSN